MMRISPSTYNAYAPPVSASQKMQVASPIRSQVLSAKKVHFSGEKPKEKGWLGRMMDKIKGWWNKFISIFKGSQKKTDSSTTTKKDESDNTVKPETVNSNSKTSSKSTKEQLLAELKKLEEAQEQNLHALDKAKETHLVHLILGNDEPTLRAPQENTKILSGAAKTFFENLNKQKELILKIEGEFGDDLKKKKNELAESEKKYAEENKSPELLDADIKKQREFYAVHKVTIEERFDLILKQLSSGEITKGDAVKRFYLNALQLVGGSPSGERFKDALDKTHKELEPELNELVKAFEKENLSEEDTKKFFLHYVARVNSQLGQNIMESELS